MDIDGELPLVADLDPSTAKQALTVLQRELRPSILRTLERLYSEGRDDQRTLTELATLEFRLLELESYSSAIEDILSASGELPSLHATIPSFTDLETDGETYARARAILFFCQQSRYFVHGPILVQHIISLAERILLPRESIVEIKEVRYQDFVLNNLHFYISTEGSRHRYSGENRPSITARLLTSEGRLVTCEGFQIPEDMVTGQAGINRCTLALVGGAIAYDDEREVFLMPLREPADGGLTQDLQSTSVRAATLVELIGVAGMNTRRQGGSLRIPVRIRGCPVFEGLSEMLRIGTALEFRIGPAVRPQNRDQVGFLPFEYRFAPEQIGFSSATLAETTASVARLLRW
jgi:hypothetical protein